MITEIYKAIKKSFCITYYYLPVDSSPNPFLKKQPPQVKPKPQKPKTPLLPPTSIHRSAKRHSDKIPSKRFSDGYVTMKPDGMYYTQYGL